MKRSLLCFILFFSFCFSNSYSQDKNYDISAPTDLPQTGVNKVLCMKNGNTILFHFEKDKDIRVIVFDSLHKEIANSKQQTKVIDNNTFESIGFKGLYEINGEAVLFFDQERFSKHCLIRLCFNAQNGNLTEEKVVAESKSMSKPTDFYVMKNRDEDEYSILFSTDDPSFKKCAINVSTYNKKHESIRDVTLDVDRKKYDYLEVVNAASKPNGINVSIVCGSLKEGGSLSGGAHAVYDHHLILFYIPRNASNGMSASVHLPDDIAPLFCNYTYNSFSKAFNVLFLSYKDVQYKYGLEWRPAAEIQHIFFRVDEDNMDVKYKWVYNTLASNELKQKGDTTAFFEGIPITMYTNDNGLSTVIYESFSRDWEPESRIRNNYYSYLGHIGITQLDDDGNELWGTVLPLEQRYKSYQVYLSPYTLMKKWQGLIEGLPDDIYERQFVSVNSYNYDKNIYIVFNDNDKNFNNSIEHPGDTVYSFNTTNACYYKMDRKKEITKHFLYGTPEANEYKACFIDGADFDEKRGVYASLIQYKKGYDVSLRMAWRKLD